MLLLLVSTESSICWLAIRGKPSQFWLSIFMVIGISVTQKHRTERTLEALRDLTSPRALVMGPKRLRRIPAREVVPGDIVILQRRRPRPGGRTGARERLARAR